MPVFSQGERGERTGASAAAPPLAGVRVKAQGKILFVYGTTASVFNSCFLCQTADLQVIMFSAASLWPHAPRQMKRVIAWKLQLPVSHGTWHSQGMSFLKGKKINLWWQFIFGVPSSCFKPGDSLLIEFFKFSF